ncbi:MAG: phosphoribosyltransferase [Gammaproteobacteria bacterium]|nr:phosphoribosyltransferase [Gammaproteobacteria bacterium]
MREQAEKIFIQEEDLLLDAFRLGMLVYRSGFRPSFIVGLWRGGSSIGIFVQECLQHLGLQTDHISIRTSYRGMQRYAHMVDNPQSEIRVHGTQYLLEHLNADDGLLIVDDVYSSGLSIKAVIERLSQRTKRNMPHNVRVAVPWYKPECNRTGREPEYYLHTTDKWLVLPYELNGLSAAEIEAHKPFVKPILDELQRYIN